MNTTQETEDSLEKASRLARTGLNTQHALSYSESWQEASALALVSIARSLESLATTLDANVGASRDGGTRL